jgi:hypothetical protein
MIKTKLSSKITPKIKENKRTFTRNYDFFQKPYIKISPNEEILENFEPKMSLL